MPLQKRSGNMYEWVTHQHAHLRGACPHACPYCYVQAIDARFKSSHHQGPPRLAEAELAVDYGSDKTIFIEHTNDLFAAEIRKEDIEAILSHCRRYPDNTYVLQTKNPDRLLDMIDRVPVLDRVIIGTTIESDIHAVGKAPPPWHRYLAFEILAQAATNSFITVEPVLKFSPAFAQDLIECSPGFINLGADSKRTPGLEEPTADELRAFIAEIRDAGVDLRIKPNLARLLPEAALLAPPKPRFKFECPNCGHVEIFNEVKETVSCPACERNYSVTNKLALSAVASALFPGART